MHFSSVKNRTGLFGAVALVLMHIGIAEAAAESRFGSFGRRPVNFGFGRNFGFGGFAINRNGERIFNGINVDRLGETGFSRLRADGNNLVELSRDGTINRVFLDNFGRVFGVRDPQTIPQLKSFFLNNLDKLRGNQGLAVRRFLARNGAGNAIFGGIAVDLRNIVELDKGVFPFAPEGDQTPIALAALNYLLNTISQSSALIRVGRQNMRADGLVGLNLNGFIRGEALAALVDDNPYSCGSGRVRLDWLISRAMDPTLYYQTIGAPATFQQLAAQTGIEPNRRFTVGNKVLIAPPGNGQSPESLVGRHLERILEVQNMRNVPGGSFYMTYDNPYNQSPGAKADSTSVKLNGIDTPFVAGEAIFHKPNGFLGFWLSTADGKRQNSAPVEIAQNDRSLPHSAKDVSAPLACYRCHNNGLVGGGAMLKDMDGQPDTVERYTDNFNLLTSRGLNRQGHFTTNAVYNARRARDSRIFRNALIRSGSYWPDPINKDKNTGEVGAADLLGPYVDQFRAPLTMAAVARELGTTPQVAAQVLRRPENDVIQREEFERAYCTLLAQVRSIPGGAPQTPIDARRVASQTPAGAGASSAPVTATSGVAHQGSNGGGASSSRPLAQ
jgi:hypothetical protein